MQKSELRRHCSSGLRAGHHRAWRSSGSDASSSAETFPIAASTIQSEFTNKLALPTSSVDGKKTERRRQRGLRRIWSAVRSVSGTGTTQTSVTDQTDIDLESNSNTPACSLPLLQVWPSQDSPRGEADGQSFIFPVSSPRSPHSPAGDSGFPHDSGIESVQASPSPLPCSTSSERAGSASPNGSKWRAGGAGLLHPDHARLLRQPGVDEDAPPLLTAHSSGIGRLSNSSSTTSSMNSVHLCSQSSQRTSDPWLRDDRRRSSTMTARPAESGRPASISGRSSNQQAKVSQGGVRNSSLYLYPYSLYDALDLEYALLRAAARGSVGPYSLSESLHKLTFTQSLAFPALARGLAGKRNRAPQSQTTMTSGAEPALNTIAKVITTLTLVLLSVLVFCVVYKFVQT